ncbi:hypothetical protein F511_16619 [Dorcoceras hygrometricum]|uniref:Uncharacterized protein n=1 Tax=Dorcoceras hygrometricum TaxID=472368 RepID=A0A2Z7BRB0_9LAMI|nr:hypothetical protein F511_16619 [Dorcoceras hygrometricum]
MGPISSTGPKTSRAARDRPEQNPRRNQPSRHRRSFAGAAAATGGATQKSSHGSRATHGRAQSIACRSASKLRPWRHASSHRRPPRATSARPTMQQRPPSSFRNRSASMLPAVQHLRAKGQQIMRHSCGTAAPIDRRSGAAMRARARIIARPSTATITRPARHRVLMFAPPHASVAWP